MLNSEKRITPGHLSAAAYETNAGSRPCSCVSEGDPRHQLCHSLHMAAALIVLLLSAAAALVRAEAPCAPPYSGRHVPIDGLEGQVRTVETLEGCQARCTAVRATGRFL